MKLSYSDLTEEESVIVEKHILETIDLAKNAKAAVTNSGRPELQHLLTGLEEGIQYQELELALLHKAKSTLH